MRKLLCYRIVVFGRYAVPSMRMYSIYEVAVCSAAHRRDSIVMTRNHDTEA
jgi:hypothetical protein